MLKDLLKKFSSQESLTFAEKMELTKVFNEATEEEQKESAPEVEATLNKYNDPEKADMLKELNDLRSEKKFSTTKESFAKIHAFNLPEDDKKAEATEILKIFSTLADENLTKVVAFFSGYQAVLDVLTNGQLGKSFATKEKEVETEAKKSKDGKEEVTESAYAKICSDYAEKEKMSVSDAHDKLKGKYTIITK